MPDAAGTPVSQPPAGALPPGGAVPPVPPAPPAPAPSAWATVQELLRELPGLVSDRIELFSLEMQRAARALAQIVILLVAAAVVGVTTWLALWVGLALGLMALGLPGGWTLVLVLAINAAAVYLALLRVRRLAQLLRLPATQRHLTRRPEAAPNPPAAASAGQT